MDLDKSFSINCIWEACKLVEFWIDVFLDISEEIIISLSITTKSIWDFLCDVKVSDSSYSFKLSEDNLLIRLSNNHLFSLILILIFREPWVTLEEFLEDLLTLIRENLLNTGNWFQKIWCGQNLKTKLHSLNVIHIDWFLMSLEKSTNNQWTFNRHLIKLFDIEILFAFNNHFSNWNGNARC